MKQFDHDQMLTFALAAIEAFARAHPDECFYGFSIDATLLCLNSEEAFAGALHAYQAKWPVRYANPDGYAN